MMLPTAQGLLNFAVTDAEKWTAWSADTRSATHYAPPFAAEINATYTTHNAAAVKNAIRWFRSRRAALDDGKVRGGECARRFSAATCAADNPRHVYDADEDRTAIETDLPHAIMSTPFGWTAENPDGTDPNRFYCDIRRADVRAWLSDRRVARTIADGFRVLMLDGLTIGGYASPVASGEALAAEWDDAQRELIAGTLTKCRAAGILLVCEIDADPHANWDALRDAADGICCPNPLDESDVLPDPEAVENQINAMTRMLDAGKMVLLRPPRAGTIPEESRRRLCACAIMFARGTTADSGFVLGTAYEGTGEPKIEDWFTWPMMFGKPVGPYRRDGAVFSREFSGGILVMDLAEAATGAGTATFRRQRLRPNQRRGQEIGREMRRLSALLQQREPAGPKLRGTENARQQSRELRRARREIDAGFPAGQSRKESIRRNLQIIDREL